MLAFAELLDSLMPRGCWVGTDQFPAAEAGARHFGWPHSCQLQSPWQLLLQLRTHQGPGAFCLQHYQTRKSSAGISAQQVCGLAFELSDSTHSEWAVLKFVQAGSF